MTRVRLSPRELKAGAGGMSAAPQVKPLGKGDRVTLDNGSIAEVLGPAPRTPGRLHVIVVEPRGYHKELDCGLFYDPPAPSEWKEAAA